MVAAPAPPYSEGAQVYDFLASMAVVEMGATFLAYTYEAVRDILEERILTPFEDYKPTRLARAIGPSALAKQIAADFRGV